METIIIPETRGRKFKYNLKDFKIGEARTYEGGNSNTIHSCARGYSKRNGFGWRFRTYTIAGVVTLVRIACVVLFFSLASCASFKHQANKWKGHTYEEMVEVYGAPDFWVADKHYRPIAVYIDTIKVKDPKPYAYQREINFWFDLEKKKIIKIRVY